MEKEQNQENLENQVIQVIEENQKNQENQENQENQVIQVIQENQENQEAAPVSPLSWAVACRPVLPRLAALSPSLYSPPLLWSPWWRGGQYWTIGEWSWLYLHFKDSKIGQLLFVNRTLLSLVFST